MAPQVKSGFLGYRRSVGMYAGLIRFNLYVAREKDVTESEMIPGKRWENRKLLIQHQTDPEEPVK